MEHFFNQLWYKKTDSFVTVIVPVFNREFLLLRTLNSIQQQTYKNLELIIVNDGSSDNSLDVAKKFINSCSLPACIINKKNGGVHTARNQGIKDARGFFIYFVDSDDEIVQSAVESFVNEYHLIPDNLKKEIFEIKAKTIKCNTNFPKNINFWNKRKLDKYISRIKFEMDGFRLAKILKNNLFPEPDGITFVSENILWCKLRRRYRTWLIDKEVRIYHTDAPDRLTHQKKKTIQHCKNRLWNALYYLNNKNIYIKSFSMYMKTSIIYFTFFHILKKNHEETFCKKKFNFIDLFASPIGVLLSKRIKIV